MDKAWAKPQEIVVKMIFLDNSCGFGNLICIVPTWPPKNSKTAKNFEIGKKVPFLQRLFLIWATTLFHLQGGGGAN